MQLGYSLDFKIWSGRINNNDGNNAKYVQIMDVYTDNPSDINWGGHGMNDNDIDNSDLYGPGTNSVPEPTTMILFGLGLLGLTGLNERKKISTTIVSIICVFYLFILIPTCALAANSGQFKAAGCNTGYFLVKELFSAYGEKTGNIIRLKPTGNKTAIKMLLKNKIDLAFTCKPISKLSKKFEINKSKISNWRSIPIAKDPIVVVSNMKNGVKDISIADLTSIFQGKIKNWKELGGNDLRVSIGYLSQNVESGIIPLFKEFTVGKDGSLDKNGVKFETPAQLGRFVFTIPGSIIFMAFNSYHKVHGYILKVDGIEPIKENILNGKYKLCATYYITTPENDLAVVSDLLEFTKSKQGQKIISKDFIPYSE